ncbi:MAG: hypothetical protein WD824_06845 [Cyclobacteriaceae bacterium]
MKSIPVVLFLSCTTFFASVPKTFAQDYIPIFSQDYSSRLSLEIDPITFLYKGYSLHVRYQPMFSERLLIGIGTYALDLPEPIINFNSQNRDEGWEVRIRSAYFVYGEYYIRKSNHGWFVGEQIGFQSFKVSNNSEVSGSTSFNNILLLTYLGYSWHPYKGSFYIKPWAGLGYTAKVDGINRVGSMKYDIAPLFPFVTFHVGYTF